MVRKLFILTLLAGVVMATQEMPYTIKITRDSKVHDRVAAPFWMSEYPSPVINVHATKKGVTTIKGYATLRELTVRKSCTITNGLYHPWAKESNSVLQFYTIGPVESYKVTVDLPTQLLEDIAQDDSKRSVQRGDTIHNTVYLAEGRAVGVLHSNQKNDTLIEFSSDIFEKNRGIFEQIEKVDTYPKTEQWLYLQCQEGYKIFVQDDDLLSQDGIKEGKTVGYGDISS